MSTLKKNSEIVLNIKKLKKLNEAIAVPEGESQPEVLIKNVLPGQTVKAKVTKKRGQKVWAKKLETLKSAENEITAVCENFGRCGGCLFLNLSYEDELALKENYLRELFKDYNFLELTPSPSRAHYRNKMEYSFGDEQKDGDLRLGLHERERFYNVLDTDDCLLTDVDFDRIRKAVLGHVKDRYGLYKKTSREGFLRHLIVRKTSTGEILVNLVTTSNDELDADSFVQALLEEDLDGKIVGILHTTNDSVADAVIPEKVRLLWGKDEINEELLGLNFKISPFSFFQVNKEGTEVLYQKVRDLIEKSFPDEKPLIFDLYSGTGTIAQVVAPLAKRVLAIEIVEEAVKKARENAKINGLDNIVFRAGDVLKEIDEIVEIPDLIILDPPREGIRPKALKKILEFGPEYFIYISCSPESLKRDLIAFEEAGYKVESLESVDMFPRTAHVETVALLKRI